MITIKENSCCSQPVTEESNSQCGSSGCGNDNSCGLFSDPRWVQENIEYFPVGFAAENGIFKNISPRETHQMIQDHAQNQNLVVLDVKTKQEYLQYHLSNSKLLDFFSPTFKDDLFSLDKNKIYIVICTVGFRSEMAMKIMKKMGFNKVYNVVGGDRRWAAEEIPCS